jgi:hypothetical protein
MANICTNCGSQLKDTAKFCASCGTPFVVPVQAEQQPAYEQPPQQAQYAPPPPPQQYAQQAPAAPKKINMKLIIIAAAAAAVVVVLIATGVFGLAGGKTSGFLARFLGHTPSFRRFRRVNQSGIAALVRHAGTLPPAGQI